MTARHASALRGGAAQTGPIARTEPRAAVVDRLIALPRQGAAAGCELAVFPEARLTAFFAHWWIEDAAGLDARFETAMPSNETAPLFAGARRLGVGFQLGHRELVREPARTRRFNPDVPPGQPMIAADLVVAGSLRREARTDGLGERRGGPGAAGQARRTASSRGPRSASGSAVRSLSSVPRSFRRAASPSASRRSPRKAGGATSSSRA